MCSAELNCFVDADHAGNQITRQSHTGVLLFVCRAPIIWYSKQQNTVEMSTFGSEFIAAKTATEIIQALRYKLRIMCIQIDGPTICFVITRQWLGIQPYQNLLLSRSMLQIVIIAHAKGVYWA